MHLLFHKQTSLLPICAEASQIGLDATIEIAYATALAVFSIAQFLRYASEWGIKMIILIAGASHTGKTTLAQRLLEKYKYPYLSIDLLKMGLIRSGNTTLTPQDDKELEVYLWKIVREIIKTAIENHQNLIVEGCYIPFNWKKDFDEKYLGEIKHYILVMTESYINNNFDKIKKYANVIESRLDDSCCIIESVRKDNLYNFEMCKQYDCNCILIDKNYEIDIEL